MTTHALMELADSLAGLPKISESGRNDDGIEGVAIPGVDCYDFDKLMREAATQLRIAVAEGGEAVAFIDPQSVQNFKSRACTKEWMWRDNDVGLVPVYLHPPTDSDGEKQ